MIEPEVQIEVVAEVHDLLNPPKLTFRAQCPAKRGSQLNTFKAWLEAIGKDEITWDPVSNQLQSTVKIEQGTDDSASGSSDGEQEFSIPAR